MGIYRGFSIKGEWENIGGCPMKGMKINRNLLGVTLSRGQIIGIYFISKITHEAKINIVRQGISNN